MEKKKKKKVFAAVRAATEAHGPISFLFANAGIGPCGLFLEGCEKKSAAAKALAAAAAAGTSKKKTGAPLSRSHPEAPAGAGTAAAPSCPWQKTMDVNYGGVVNVLQAALPGMVAAGRGRVVVTGSMGEGGSEGDVFFCLPFFFSALRRSRKKKTKPTRTPPPKKKKNSPGGFMGAAGLSAYSASKHALRGLCDCLRLEVRERER